MTPQACFERRGQPTSKCRQRLRERLGAVFDLAGQDVADQLAELYGITGTLKALASSIPRLVARQDARDGRSKGIFH